MVLALRRVVCDRPCGDGKRDWFFVRKSEKLGNSERKNYSAAGSLEVLAEFFFALFFLNSSHKANNASLSSRVIRSRSSGDFDNQIANCNCLTCGGVSSITIISQRYLILILLSSSLYNPAQGLHIAPGFLYLPFARPTASPVSILILKLTNPRAKLR